MKRVLEATLSEAQETVIFEQAGPGFHSLPIGRQASSVASSTHTFGQGTLPARRHVMFIAWRGGDPCQLCTGPIKRTATHWGPCWAHWLGANPLQRALAAFDDYWDHEEDRMEAQLKADLEAYGHEVA